MSQTMNHSNTAEPWQWFDLVGRLDWHNAGSRPSEDAVYCRYSFELVYTHANLLGSSR
jgi:hypothetical protein